MVVPEDKEIPEGLDEEVIAMKRPVKNLYLVSTGVMDMFDAIDSLDTIRFSGQKEDGWHVESAREAMKKGDIIYAGSYNTPDYELLVSEHCSISIQGPMNLYAPEAREMLNHNRRIGNGQSTGNAGRSCRDSADGLHESYSVKTHKSHRFPGNSKR
ncbi:MAG: hypothetical protein GX213_01675 [Clostridiaceae bacterium]|nr:hypothetical protein [Clostridiaceae bacterium]